LLTDILKMHKQSLQLAADCCLNVRNIEEKKRFTHQIRNDWLKQEYKIDKKFVANSECISLYPDGISQVETHQLSKRSISNEIGHASLLHSFAHIEYNAINIAWDAIYRFPFMPNEFYDDWTKIASEEAYHFSLIHEYLNELGYQYGSFPVHGDLWEMVNLTKHDILHRMALVPRVLEARGLDVTPSMISRFNHHGYSKAASILEIIYNDEIGHVEIGSKWFHYICDQRKLNSSDVFSDLVCQYAINKIRKPFNEAARKKAGFSKTELEFLNSCR